MGKIAEVDKGVPVRGSKRPRPRYPWDLMTEVGDSFFIPMAEYDSKLYHKTMLAVRYRNGLAYNPQRFEIRYVEGGIRVWRVENANGNG
jgi:hypothetical protein